MSRINVRTPERVPQASSDPGFDPVPSVCPQTLMEQKRSPAAVAVVMLLAVCLQRRAASAGSNCRLNGAPLSSVVDTVTAERSQRRHLEALFNR